jgi:hypothetical protein
VGADHHLPLAILLLWAWALMITDGLVVKLTSAIYQEGAFTPERLGVLIDALLDAGCADGDLLRHLRWPRPHVRGCWAVDALLGKS